jgi:hypothetical protein
LTEALTGIPFVTGDIYYGVLRRPDEAAKMRDDYDKRLEVQLAKDWGKRVIQETGQAADERRVITP